MWRQQHKCKKNSKGFLLEIVTLCAWMDNSENWKCFRNFWATKHSKVVEILGPLTGKKFLKFVSMFAKFCSLCREASDCNKRKTRNSGKCVTGLDKIKGENFYQNNKIYNRLTFDFFFSLAFHNSCKKRIFSCSKSQNHEEKITVGEVCVLPPQDLSANKTKQGASWNLSGLFFAPFQNLWHSFILEIFWRFSFVVSLEIWTKTWFALNRKFLWIARKTKDANRNPDAAQTLWRLTRNRRNKGPMHEPQIHGHQSLAGPFVVFVFWQHLKKSVPKEGCLPCLAVIRMDVARRSVSPTPDPEPGEETGCGQTHGGGPLFGEWKMGAQRICRICTRVLVSCIFAPDGWENEWSLFEVWW